MKNRLYNKLVKVSEYLNRLSIFGASESIVPPKPQTYKELRGFHHTYTPDERQMMEKYLSERGWQSLWHWDNWVKAEWIEDPTKNVDRMGRSIIDAYNMLKDDERRGITRTDNTVKFVCRPKLNTPKVHVDPEEIECTNGICSNRFVPQKNGNGRIYTHCPECMRQNAIKYIYQQKK